MTTSNLIQPLKNVRLFSELMERVVERAPHLPGMASFSGFSGYGKTYSAIDARIKYRALYLECGQSWTKKAFLINLCRELGVSENGPVYELIDRAIEGIGLNQKPLIVDEADHIIKRGYIDMVREIYDKTHAPIVLIGEENLPSKISKDGGDRVRNRMLEFVQAVPADLSDCKFLCNHYGKGVAFSDDLIAAIAKASKGRIRRICVNIDRACDAAYTQGSQRIDLAMWQQSKRVFESGIIPKCRRVA